ncbi:PREDICTED: lysoplasmalogenase [Ceratotherium simum simum]|uniref:Lysoplasmalogenase TMEM86B n=1 Tax=Ceratotherium simum simum TaxID=73337 RepID=A0ABM0I320_CERSS|nr:PREDICTED: lysoplasmalogenase [Ceratotherium simum simum]
MDAGKKGLPQESRFSAQPPYVGRWLSLFFLTCAVYLLLWTPEAPPSRVGALVKCLPVLCLVVLLRAVRSSALLQGGLLCSAVGDACLLWPAAFLYGVAAFAAAHLLYLWAFGLTPLRPGLLLPIVLASVPYCGLLLLHLSPGMVPPLTAYALALATMLWRGLARGGSASWGALLFTLSDAVLAWDTFFQPLPHARMVVMATYYSAQVLIALSAFQGPGLQTN